MLRQCRAGGIALAAMLSIGIAGARAGDTATYPDLNGQWSRGTPGAQWDPSKPGGLRQQAPLTAEYQAIFEANLKALASGNEAYNAHSRCFPAGMPRMMLAYEPVDLIVTPETTYQGISATISTSSAASTPTGGLGRRTSCHRSTAIPSVNGRARMRRGVTACWWVGDSPARGPRVLRRHRGPAACRQQDGDQGTDIPRIRPSTTSCVTRSAPPIATMSR